MSVEANLLNLFIAFTKLASAPACSRRITPERGHRHNEREREKRISLYTYNIEP
jgi:hypothetical protein